MVEEVTLSDVSIRTAESSNMKAGFCLLPNFKHRRLDLFHVMKGTVSRFC
jgi:hypothetical protein